MGTLIDSVTDVLRVILCVARRAIDKEPAPAAAVWAQQGSFSVALASFDIAPASRYSALDCFVDVLVGVGREQHSSGSGVPQRPEQARVRGAAAAHTLLSARAMCEEESADRSDRVPGLSR